MSTTVHLKPTPRWLKPGVTLMRRMRMTTKLTGMALLLLTPLVLVLVILLTVLSKDLATAQAELRGLQLADALTQLVVHTQTHRGLTNRLLSGDAGAKAPQEKTREALRQTLQQVDTLVKSPDNTPLATPWSTTRSGVDSLLRDAPAEQRAQVFAEHTRTVTQLQKLIFLTGEHSGLLLDPEAVSYLLMDIVVEKSTPWMETLGLMRGAGSGLVARAASATPAEVATILGMGQQLQGNTEAIQMRLEALKRQGFRPIAEWEAAASQTQAFGEAMRAALGGASVQGDPAALFEQGTRAIGAARAFQQACIQHLQTELSRRVGDIQQRLALVALISGLGILLLAYSMAAFRSATLTSVTQLSAAMAHAARGNLTAVVNVSGTDELTDIGREFEGMLKSLSELVAEVRSAAVMVGDVGQSLVNDSNNLAGRTQSQAASLEETSASVRMVSDTVRQNSDACRQVSGMTRVLQQQTETAGAKMGETVLGMDSLKSTSARMSDIISTIDSIAFQTNILALNAAVEAARAGEQGRGFAVVATEVRSLAGRTSNAAKEVRKLIDESAECVSHSVEQIGAVNEVVAGLVTRIREVAHNVDTIADTSSTQSDSLSQVVAAVGDLDSVTTENSLLVDRTQHRSVRLMERASQLNHAVNHMTLRQGTADEAKAMTEKAHALVKQVGLDKASSEFYRKDGPFIKNDLYVFVLDRAGYYKVMGMDRAKSGTHLSAAPGVDAAKLLEDAWHRADQGGGWIDYNIINLATGDVRGKSSFILPLGKDLLIGCGAYRSQVRTQEEIERNAVLRLG